MSDLTIALITIFGTVASVGGIVLYVFNGTRKLIKEMHGTIREMHGTIREMHGTIREMHGTMEEIRKTQRDIVELLKKGFSEVLAEVRK